MDCKKANDLMMKFMDSELNEDDAFLLKEHVNNCHSCKEDFIIYNQILEEFSDLNNVISAPDDFEINVMSKINDLGNIYSNAEIRKDNVFCILWGLFSVFAGLGTMLVLYKESIINFLSGTPNMSKLIQYLEPVEVFADNFKYSFIQLVNSVMSVATEYAVNLKYVSLIIFILLIAAQYFIYKKDKVEI